MRKGTLIFILSLLIFGIYIWGCADYKGDAYDNQPPTVIHYPPVDSEVVGAAPIIFWRGFDQDGEVYHFEYIDIIKSKLEESEYNGYFDDPATIPWEFTGNGGFVFHWDSTNNDRDTIYMSLEAGEDTTEHLFCLRGRDQNGLYSETECVIWYRTNQPPDSIRITTDTTRITDGDTLWCLKQNSYSWHGIGLSWMGHDPDGSIILEYNWEVKNRNTGEIARSSIVEDSINGGEGGPYSGDDPMDGWLRERRNTTLYDIPTGDYWFIVRVRDDAFYESLADTLSISIVKPLFDPSDSVIYQSMLDGTFRHKIMIVDETNEFLFGAQRVPPQEDWDAFYQDVFADLGAPYDDYTWKDIAGSALIPPAWSLTKHELAEHSILFWSDADGGNSAKMSEESVVPGLKDYISVGGLVVLEGRNCFGNTSDMTSDTSVARMYFGVQDQYSGTLDHAEGITTSLYDYNDLSFDADVVELLGTNTTQFIYGLSKVEDNTIGLPVAEAFYLFRNQEGDMTDAEGKPLAIRYKTTSFRTSYFAFPLFFMDNSEGEVTEAVRQTLDFMTDKFPFAPPDTTELEQL